MLKSLRKYLWRSEGQENLGAPANTRITFQIRYNDLLVGELRSADGEWVFHYSPEFKLAKPFPGIMDFPDLEREYRGQELWPFFARGIPSIENPHVRETLAKEKVSANDEAGLLRLFGNRTIANPFRLVALA